MVMLSELEHEKRINSTTNKSAGKIPDQPFSGEFPPVRIYRRRYVFLIIMAFGSFMSDVTYSQYSIIGDVLVKYYKVSTIAIQWTSICYLLGYLVPVYPTILFFNKYGIKCTFVVGLLLVAAGLWIQGAGTQTDLFWLILLGQVLVSLAQCAFVNLTPQFVSYWFDSNEVSTACAVGVFSNTAGMAISCILTPLIVHNTSFALIGLNLSYLNYTLAVITTSLAIITILVFEERPPFPPSEAQAKIWNHSQKVSAAANFRKDIKDLLKNNNFLIHLASSGMILSFVGFAIIILNQLLTNKYPGCTDDIGAIGLVMYFMGIPGTLVLGRIIDKTQKYKEVALGNNICIFLSLAFFLGSIYINITTVYVASVIFGFFLIGYINIGLEMASEISYPVSEVASSSLVLFVGAVLGIIMTHVSNWLISSYDIIVSEIVLLLFCLTGVIMSGFVQSDLRRIKASESNIKTSQANNNC